MEYKLDKELLKAIRESDKEEIKLKINDNKIELVEENEWKVGGFYYYVLYSSKIKDYYALRGAIDNIYDLNAIKKGKTIKYFHTLEEAQEYIDWLNIRTVVEETIDELGRPTIEEVEDEKIDLYFIFSAPTNSLSEPKTTVGYENSFICKKRFLNELIRKFGAEKIKFFYKNLWRFL